MQKSQCDIRLTEAGQLTGVDWAVYLDHSNEWELKGSYKITLKQRKEILKLLLLPRMKSWINGAVTGKSSRLRKIPGMMDLPEKTLYIFPNPETCCVILVSTENMSGAFRKFWRRVALEDSNDLSSAQVIKARSLDLELVPFNEPHTLDRIMEEVIKISHCQGGWLAVRSGEYLEIKAQTDNSEHPAGRISIIRNPLLQEIVHSRKTCIVKKNEPDWKLITHKGFVPSTKFWLALPLVIGKRLVAVIALWDKSAFSDVVMEKLRLLARRIAPPVESSITFTDLTNHLHRLAYLNDFAVTVFSSQDMEQVVQRTFGLLQRAFRTTRVVLLLQSLNGTNIHYLNDSNGSVIFETSSKLLLPSTVVKGTTYRTDIIASGSPYKPVYSGSKSGVMAPIKYQKRVIGAVGLESDIEGRFTVNDEHLVAVIACYIASFLENGRLREEAEAKARNLSMIHEVVERVIGKTDVRQVAQVAAELMARNRIYDLVVVALVRGPKKELQLAGIGGKVADDVQNTLKFLNSANENKIAMRVAATGKSALVNDVRDGSAQLHRLGWTTSSEMCVAMKEGEQSFGVIEVKSNRKNAFSKNDLLVLESLGGILASVISNVGQYQKLQMTVKQLQATQEDLQEHITAQQEAERRLVQAAKLAAVGEMAAGIAHELNNPLTTVIGFTELTMEEVSPDSRIRTDLELVLREAHRATDVVRRLLDFARQSESVRTHSEINEIVKEVLTLINHLLHTSGVQLILDLPNGLPNISVDKNQIKQVILNLIHNALHAMPKGGELQITTQRRSRDHQDWVTVTISDTGTGISPENLDRIFEPFFTTRAKEGGTGLGLSISYGIVAEHGGFIEAESQVSKGSKFSIWIPVEVN